MGQLNSTLFTGLSGLVVNQTQLNVVGNNIANANTTAFKSSRVLFSPQFYVTDNPGSASNGTFGGSNPNQVGLGAQVASVEQNFNQGELQTTGVQSDLGIDGKGFFIVKDSSNQQLYTRDGAFSLNDQNALVDGAGDFVQGYGVNSDFQIVPGKLQNISIPLGQETIAQATKNASLTGTLNAGGTAASDATELISGALTDSTTGTLTGASLLTNVENFGGTVALFNVGDVLTLNGDQNGRALPTQTFTVNATNTFGDLESFLQDGLSIDPNPSTGTPGPTPGASIVSATGGGQQLLLTGNIGNDNALSIAAGGFVNQTGASPLDFLPTGGANGGTTHTANGESAHANITAYDSLGNAITLDVNTVLASQNAGGTTWDFYVSSPDNVGGDPVLGNGTLTFDTSGQLTAVTGNTVTINRTGTGATALQQITLDFSGVQALSTGASSTMVSESQDGFAFGTLNNYSIGVDGTITGTFSNGLTQTIGQVAIANFQNPNGLDDMGNSQYSAGADSGEAIITTPGSQGTGQIKAGTLEMSNVDLSEEFINLIIASTGYSAASRVISTSDQLLTELLNSQR
jgi:flagellar hook protein FlgE